MTEEKATASAAPAMLKAAAKGAPKAAAAPKAEAKAKAAAPKKVVDGCYNVVSRATRKGKGRGKDMSGGGYVPVHLRDPAEVEAEAEAAKAEVAAKKEEEEQAAALAAAEAELAAAMAEEAAAAAAAAAASPPAETAAGTAEGGASPAAAAQAEEKEKAEVAGDATPASGSTTATAATLSGASFDSTAGLSTAGSFDAEMGDSGTSVKKRAKRWQRRASASTTDVAAAEGEPAEKKLKASPPASPTGGDIPMGSPADADPLGAANFPFSPVVDLPPESPLPPPTPVPDGPATLAKLSISKLKTLAKYHSVSIMGCLEKSDMVAALKKAGIDDEHAEKEADRARVAAAPQQPTQSDREKEREKKAQEHASKRAAAKVAEAEKRAEEAEAEMRRMKQELEASKTSSKKKWMPAFSSTPFIAGSDKDVPQPKPGDLGFPPRSPGAMMPPGGKGGMGAGGFSAAGVRPPQGGGIDMRFSPGRPPMGMGGMGGKGGGDPNDMTCWEFKRGACTKGMACKWRHS